jgi:hypothetical protein
MQIDGAIVREQGVTFGIVVVQPHVTSSPSQAARIREAYQSQVRDFAEIPLILASQDSRGRFEYQGKHDIVEFLASIDASRIPWKRYTIS